MVVVADTGFNYSLRFVNCVEYPVQAEVNFEDTVNPFGNGILVPTSILASVKSLVQKLSKALLNRIVTH